MDAVNITGDGLKEQKERLELLIRTRKGTLPGNRAYGLDGDFIDSTPEAAGTRFAMEVFTSARDWLPGAEVTEADYSADGDGKVTARIKIESGDDYA